MAEQYIYSRAEKEFTNALNQTVPVGFGFMSLSSGMNHMLKEAVKNHCQDCPRCSQKDSMGIPLPLFRKVRLPKGQTLLQKSTWIVNSGRDFPVSHGYVLEDAEMKESGPARWLDTLFRLEDPNEKTEPVLLESRLELMHKEAFPVKSLKETMDTLGICRSCFCQILLACFDALGERRQVLIAWDFHQSGEGEFRRSVLYWLYTCMPYDLWSGLGFDSIYTVMSSPGQIHFSFVDKSQIRNADQTFYIQVGNQLYPQGGNYLVYNGTVFHNDRYPTAWYGKNNVYVRWLEQVVNTLWACPEEMLPPVTRALTQFHRKFQELLSMREDRLDPQWYSAVCMRSLRDAPQALSEACKQVRNSITESELYDFRLAFMDSFTETEQEEILLKLPQSYRKSGAPLREKDAKMLCAMFENRPRISVVALISAFMAREADAPGTGVMTVIYRYREMLPSDLYAMMPARVFFSEFSETEVWIWKHCGADYSGEAAKRRRDLWFAENYKPLWDMPASISHALAVLNGLSSQQQAALWREPFQNRYQTIFEKELEGITNEWTPQRFRRLEQELSNLPGGIPRDTLVVLKQNAYRKLLSHPAPFMNDQWLRAATGGLKIDGEVGEVLEILSAFANSDKGSYNSWKRCCKNKSEAAQKKAFAALPRMFLNGTLPKIQVGFVISFLFLERENSRRILFQTASQGGGKMLIDLLRRARKYPLKYPDRLGPGEPTLLFTLIKILSRDWAIANKLKEKDGTQMSFYEDMKKFLQEPETEKILLPIDISNAVDDVEEQIPPAGNSGGRWKINKQRR